MTKTVLQKFGLKTFKKKCADEFPRMRLQVRVREREFGILSWE